MSEMTARRRPAHREPGRVVWTPRAARVAATIRGLVDVPAAAAMEPPRWFRVVWSVCVAGVVALAWLGAAGLVQ